MYDLSDFKIGSKARIIDKDSPIFGGEYEVLEKGELGLKFYIGGEYIWVKEFRCRPIEYELEPHVLVDLDKTLSYYEGWKGIEHIGPPIQPMVKIINTLIENGKTIKIFTARADDPKSIPYIEKWLIDVFGKTFPITNVKSMAASVLIDDRAMGVQGEGELCPLCLIRLGPRLGI